MSRLPKFPNITAPTRDRGRKMDQPETVRLESLERTPSFTLRDDRRKKPNTIPASDSLPARGGVHHFEKL